MEAVRAHIIPINSFFIDTWKALVTKLLVSLDGKNPSEKKASSTCID